MPIASSATIEIPNDPVFNVETPRLRVVVVGHVDHGKSTLIGRIFFDTDSLPEGKVEAIQKASEAEGMAFEYAFLLDALLEEQEQNITIDTTQLPFQTATRGYTLIDAPGHKEFLKNMVTGAASADAAVLLIAAGEGVREQSRRHAYLLSLLGVRQIVVAVNKMDLVDYDQEVFKAIETEYGAFLAQIGITAERFIPISARQGDNVASPAPDTMPWYDGPTILGALDAFAAPLPDAALPLRFPVQDVYRFDARRILAGRVETGTLRAGDRLRFAPGDREAVVATIERWNGTDFRAGVAVAGESVGITLDEQIFVQRGAIAFPADSETPAATTRRFTARVFWMGQDDLATGSRFKLKLATQQTEATVISVDRVIDASSLDTRESGREGQIVHRNDVAEMTLETTAPIALDTYETLAPTGRFVLVAGRKVSGGGIVLRTDATPAATAPKSDNLTWSLSHIAPAERAARNGGQRGAVVWLTGLSGAGKSTIAHAVARDLFDRKINAFVLDGDNVRHGLCADLGFSPEEREENIRRVAHAARLLADAGVIVVAALISPYRDSRARAREIIEAGGETPFIEVFVDAPLETCEERDPKGLYQKARAGELKGFTGIDAPYEAPLAAEVVVQTGAQSPEESAEVVVRETLARTRL